MNRLIIRNARIVTENAIVEGDLLAEEGRIAAIAYPPACPPACPPAAPGGAEEVDAGGLFLGPGFIDLHNHGRLGANVMDGRESSLETIARGQLSHGVTGFLAGTSSAVWERNLAAVRAAAGWSAGERQDMARCLGLYLEGNYFSMEKRGAHNPKYLRPLSAEEMGTLLEAGGGAVKVVCLSPELPGAAAVIRFLREQGVVVSAAHSNAVYEEALAGINAGITQSTHTFNGMRGLSQHEPGIVGAVLTDDRVICEAIADGIHLAPAILRMMLKLKGPDRIALISDSVELNGLDEGQYQFEGHTITVTGGAIRLEDGRLAGSCLSLDIAVRNMVRLAGASLPEAVRMASLVPARVLGLQDTKGSIAVGKDADLVLFDGELNVKEVFLGAKRGKIH
ncbi:MAG: N-acetylglucosamine-6-phosphate deacetylase [Treponema sp.]|jgi:N-acetylglucosamine-6-phosphate deacetylase|nr:N-acetylglucosamine-6-phosphate deacetylase [Treponema sp.]